MPTLDPQLNQIIWWIVLGAFIGWLLWVLIDRFVWRDGESAGVVDKEQHDLLASELENARREENLLRTELVREQEETQRLVSITKDLRDKLDGQEQIVANLEAALDAARFSAPGAAATLAENSQPGVQALPPNTALKLDQGKPQDTPEDISPAISDTDSTDQLPAEDGEQALRDLLAESDFTEDLDELLGTDEDLFGAPTDILHTRSKLGAKRADSSSDPSESSTRIRYTRPAVSDFAGADKATQNGPMTDAELDSLLNLDTGKPFGGDINTGQATDDADPTDSNPDGHTLTMLERLRDEPSARTNEAADRAAPDSSLISRLRSAFRRKPDDNERS